MRMPTTVTMTHNRVYGDSCNALAHCLHCSPSTHALRTLSDRRNNAPAAVREASLSTPAHVALAQHGAPCTGRIVGIAASGGSAQ